MAWKKFEPGVGNQKDREDKKSNTDTSEQRKIRPQIYRRTSRRVVLKEKASGDNNYHKLKIKSGKRHREGIGYI